MKELNIKKKLSLSFWINYIENLHFKKIDLGLERIKNVANKLNLLHLAPFVITVTGTNGKGTTCHLLEKILIKNNLRVGVYSSPHLLKYTERVRIQNKILSEKEHCIAMESIEKNRGKILLSYFEFGTLAAFQIFKKSNLDILILEVGLGGRLDATNIIDPNISVITNVDIDHTDYLGKKIENIAKEKTGIFRKGNIAIVGGVNRPKIINLIAKKIGTFLYVYEKDWWFSVKKNSWNWWNRKNILENLPIPNIPLNNAAIVLEIIQFLPFKILKKSIYESLNLIKLPGRFHIINFSPLTILDVAHNKNAAEYLSNRLKSLNYIGKLRVLVGILLDKDINGIVSQLKNQVYCWYCASLDNSRGATAENIASFLKNKNVKKFKSVENAWLMIKKDSSLEDCIVVFGSFFTISKIMYLEKIKIQ